MESGVYDESYRRVISVLDSVGAKLEENPETGSLRIAKKLVDKDLCLSMIDKINIKRGINIQVSAPITKTDDKVAEAESAGDEEASGGSGF